MPLKEWMFGPIRFFIDLYVYCGGRRHYWQRMQVPSLTPRIHHGNLRAFWNNTLSFSEVTQDLYNMFPNVPFFGFYQFNLPVLMICDLEMIPVLVECGCFFKHRSFASTSLDPPAVKDHFNLQAQQAYIEVRDRLCEDSQLPKMYETIKKRAIDFTEYLKGLGNQLQSVEVDDLFKKLTNDITAQTVFGYTCDSLRHPENEFYTTVELVTRPLTKKVDFMRTSVHPSMPTCYENQQYGDKIEGLFRRIVKDALKKHHRGELESATIVHQLLSVRLDTAPTFEIIVGAAGEYFMAGFDTTARAMTFMVYELALADQIQRLLLAEVDAVFRRHKRTTISHNAIEKMKYMGMVVSEVLRKWPPFATTDLRLASPYALRAGRFLLPLPRGIIFAIPVFALHRDPNIYEEPERFNPERFRDDSVNKSRFYMPFGSANRKLLSKRYDLLEIKTIMLYLLRKYKIEPVPRETDRAYTLSTTNLQPQFGQIMKVRFQPRRKL